MKRDSENVRSMRRWFGLAGAFALALAMLQTANAQDGPEGGLAGGQMIRGTVTGPANGNRVAIKTDGGELYQIAVTANTRVMKERQVFKIADIKAGDNLGAMGVLDASTHTVHAVFVTVVDAEQARKMREGLGKVYITGKITAIDELKLTVLRPDGVSQVIAVDEGTSFRRGGRQMQLFVNGGGPVRTDAGPGGAAGGPERGGESITLADIKVGDGVVGRGEVKSGTFTPTELGVMDPNARRARRRTEGAETAAPEPKE